MKLTRSLQVLLLDVHTSEGLATSRWKLYVPLSNRGLVTITRACPEPFESLWGAAGASVALTDAGRLEVRRLQEGGV